MIKTILFDYAGVITPTRNNSSFAVKNSKRFGLSPDEIIKISYDGWADAAVGKVNGKDFWEKFSSKLNIKKDELISLVIETFPIDPRMIHLIKKTKKKYTTVLFSNQAKDWLEKVIEDNNFKDIFSYFVNSYTVGARKPDKKIFEEALKITNSKPEETLLIDDTLENIEAARKMGINAILFENYDQFLNEYKKFVNFN